MQAGGSIVKRLICIFCVGLVLLISSGVDVFAYNGINTGEYLSNPFGETLNVPLGYDGVKFYDFFMPYSMSYSEIGGYATDARGTSDYAKNFEKPAKEKLKQKIGKADFTFHRQGSVLDTNKKGEYVYSRVLKQAGNGNIEEGVSKVGVDDSGLEYITCEDKNGTEFKVYIASLPKAVYNTNLMTQEQKFGTAVWSIGNRGMLYDVILSDGKQIHFCVLDAVGENHSNGGENGTEGWTGSTHDGIEYKLSKMGSKNSPYKQLFHCEKLHTFEMATRNGLDVSSFELSSTNSVVAIRVYDATIDSKNFVVNEGFTNAITESKSAQHSNAWTSAASSQYARRGYYDEMDLAAWTRLNESVISFKDRRDLDQSDLTGLHNWESNIENNKFSFIRILRYCISFMGIMFIVWGSFFYLGYWFDRINPIIPIRVVSFLSLGKLEVAPDEDECTYKLSGAGKGGLKTINHWVAIEISLTAIGFGTFLVSGWAYKLIAKLISFVTSILKFH